MQFDFVLSSQFQKTEYLSVLQEIEKEFSHQFPSVRKIVIEIKVQTKAVYKPATVISGMVSERLFKVRLNFTKFYQENRLPDPVIFCERIKAAVNRVVILSRPSQS